MPLRSRVRSVVQPEIRTRKELLTYVVRVTALCGTLAVAFDVVNQLTFFIGWEAAIRSWVISAFIGCGIAAPVAFAIARAHLELYRAKLKVEELSRTDSLTGLLNRRALLEPVEGYPPELMALVIADIDRFKRVNDTHGHLTGDRVIKLVGQAMQTELGRFGRVGRIGGEEFALVSESADTDRLLKGLWDFRDRVASTDIVAGSETFRITISIGVAVRKPGDSFDTLFCEADRALYLAKAGGRNRVVSAADTETAEPPAPRDQTEEAPAEDAVDAPNLRKYRSAV
jgi:diguanylate cyclase (GGDEF)-like protein